VEEQAHEHRPHGTGFRWLDISLALSAFIVSLASLWLTVHNARTMERLVTANSYPNIDVQPGNRFDFGDGQGLRPAVYLSLANTGIGPARLRTVEIGYGGHAALNLTELLTLCCTASPVGAAPKISYWHSGELRGAMIEAGKDISVFAWPEPAGDPRWARLEALREQLTVRICYCSVFDECYLRDSDHREPNAVKACAVPKLPWRGD
jgi:hypothetical protein